MNRKPSEEELTNRIRHQRDLSRDPYAATLLWKGYLAGLYEWGVIELDVYTRLDSALPAGGDADLVELFTGEPLSEESRKEVENHAVLRDR